MVKRKKRLESEIQREILDWLELERDILFWRSNNVPVFGRSNDGQKRYRSLPKHTPKGLPDITIIYKGMPVFLEVKRDSMTGLTEEQAVMSSRIRRAGGLYYKVWALMEVICIMEELGYEPKNSSTL